MTPQLENGYTKIANEIMEELARFRIPGEQMQCFLFILRKTYGFNKKEDRISNSQFCEATGLDKGNACRALRELSKKQLVVKNDNTNPATYGFNKDCSAWVRLSKMTTVVNFDNGVVKDDNNRCQKRRPQKKKETIQKNLKLK